MRNIKDLMSLKGRTALITGASGGIGQQIAITLAELGANLVLVDRPKADYGQLLNTLKNFNVNVPIVEFDLEHESDRDNLILTIEKQKGPLNILVNNAAFVGDSDLDGWTTKLQDQTIDTWKRALEVNLTSVFDLSKRLAPKLKKSKHGSIINISSIYGVLGPNYSLYSGTKMGNPAAYSASKGGVTQLTRWFSTTLAPDIRVNSISPGGVFRNQPDKFVNRYVSNTPLLRMAKEEDFKGAIAYFSSDLSEYVTGQDLLVDGGWSAW